MMMIHLLKVVIQEAIEDWVGAARWDSDEVENQVDLFSHDSVSVWITLNKQTNRHHAFCALEDLRHLSHQAEETGNL